MFEDTFETELTLQAKGDDLDQFLKTLEDDLVELRSEIAKFKYKRPKKGRSKRSPMSTVFDFAKLHDEIDGVESVIVAHSETNRMLHTRLRAEVGKPVKQIKDWLAGLKKIGAGVLPEELSVEISERLAPAVRERLAEARTVPENDVDTDNVSTITQAVTTQIRRRKHTQTRTFAHSRLNDACEPSPGG